VPFSAFSEEDELLYTIQVAEKDFQVVKEECEIASQKEKAVDFKSALLGHKRPTREEQK
jgi:DNA replication protein DnaD